MLDQSDGKLLVYASTGDEQVTRLKTISLATEKMAKSLNLNLEVVTSSELPAPTYVCYKNGDDEPIPIYKDKSEERSITEICALLRNMMFVLSFHPRLSALKRRRKEIMRFS